LTLVVCFCFAIIYSENSASAPSVANGYFSRCKDIVLFKIKKSFFRAFSNKKTTLSLSVVLLIYKIFLL